MLNRAAIVLLALAVVGCSDSTGAKTPTMTGTWDGGLIGATVTLVLSETAQQITGSGNAPTLAFSVTGTHVHPNVSLILKATGYGDMNFTGTFNGDLTVAGAVQGSGFTGEGLTLRKRPRQ